MSERIRVLIVDDSALVRQMLTAMLTSDPEIEVLGAAPDAMVAQRKIAQWSPDVITLDIEMPGKDGLTFLGEIMRLRPMPVVMISTLTQKGAEATVRALDLGAVDVIAKPTRDLSLHFDALRDEIVGKVKQAAKTKLRTRALAAKPTSKSIARHAQPMAGKTHRINMVAIGASTGGVVAVREVLAGLTGLPVPIAITQHMPGGFTESFAARLDRQLDLSVSEARDGEELAAGHAYIAPSTRQFRVARQGLKLCASVRSDPPVGGHCPSVDALFESVALHLGGAAIAVLLTGMGRDGASGMASIHAVGGRTIAQDEATSVVHGMPRAAIDLGAVDEQLPLGAIAGRVRAWLDEVGDGP